MSYAPDWLGYNLPWLTDTGGGASGGGFTPASIAGLVQWLDASVASSIHYGVSPLVNQWDDQSGNGNNVTQATSTKQPTDTASAINGRHALNYNQTNNTMQCVLGSGNLSTVSVFMVVEPLATPANFNALYCSDTNTGDITLEEGPSQNLNIWRTNVGHVSDTGVSSFTANNVYVVGFTWDGTTMIVYISNASAGSSTPGSSQLNASIGVGGIGGSAGFGGFAGYIAEVAVYNNVISSADRTTLYNSWKTKWGTL